jgi:catechol 2,3-dioxygenase-like lactoylglutathione lyase family enzyme
MPLTIGINHVTAVTADLDRLVRFYSDMFDAERVFEGQATNGHPRMAIVELGGTRYVNIVEDRSSARDAGAFVSVARPTTERFGLAIESHEELCQLRDRMIKAGARVGRSNGSRSTGPDLEALCEVGREVDRGRLDGRVGARGVGEVDARR